MPKDEIGHPASSTDAPPSLTSGEIEELERLYAEASPAPWEARPENYDCYAVINAPNWFEFAKVVTRLSDSKFEHPEGIANIALIVKMHAVLPRLLSSLKGSAGLRKRPIAWMRYVCGSSQFQHASDEGDPPEDQGWIALYRRGDKHAPPAPSQEGASEGEGQT